MSVYVSCHVCHSVLTSTDGTPYYSLTVCECVCQLSWCHFVLTSTDGTPCYSLTVCECVRHLSCMSLCPDLYWWCTVLLVKLCVSMYVSCHVCHFVLTSTDGTPCYSLTVCECVCQLSCMSLCPDLYWWCTVLLFNCVWVYMSAVMYVTLFWPLLMVCHVIL